ncbi:AEC family transporter [Salipiger bermudensis]|uniref:AEC family transporter n=1 Tax=Salipiger bermudensis TaxID=344736 RepID=UPI001CD5F05C|nr:AEC family transporter [Salipiger bermudensis]MCA1288256.1 AEC family transporter [Salipiger bermudensis]
MLDLVSVILPVFVVVGAGYLAAWRRMMSDAAIDGLTKFAQTWALPLLLARGISELDLSRSFDAGLLLSYYAGALICGALAYVGARALLDRPPADSVTIGFGCMFGNIALLGLPITQRAYGDAALADNFAIISIHSPLLYTIGILAMEAVRSSGTGSGLLRVGARALRGVLRTPLVMGIMFGFLLQAFRALTGLAVPELVTATMNMMAGAALPAALFGLGGILYRYRPEGDIRAIAGMTALSLVIHPAISWGMGTWMDLEASQMRSLVISAAMAPGVNAYIFANIYGVAKRVAATAVLAATALSMFTAAAWLAILP